MTSLSPVPRRTTESGHCHQLSYDVMESRSQAYVPESNQCRQLMSALTEEDLQFLHDSAKGEVLRYDKNRPQVGCSAAYQCRSSTLGFSQFRVKRNLQGHRAAKNNGRAPESSAKVAFFASLSASADNPLIFQGFLEQMRLSPPGTFWNVIRQHNIAMSSGSRGP